MDRRNNKEINRRIEAKRKASSALLQGIGSVIAPGHKFTSGHATIKNDRDALRADWKAVGDFLWESVDKVKDQKKWPLYGKKENTGK